MSDVAAKADGARDITMVTVRIRLINLFIVILLCAICIYGWFADTLFNITTKVKRTQSIFGWNAEKACWGVMG